MSRTRSFNSCHWEQSGNTCSSNGEGVISPHTAQERTQLPQQSSCNQLEIHIRWEISLDRVKKNRAYTIVCLCAFSIPAESFWMTPLSDRILPQATTPPKSQWETFQEQITSGDARKSLKSTEIEEIGWRSRNQKKWNYNNGNHKLEP